MDVNREQINKLLQKPRYHRFLGLSVESIGEGEITLRLPFRQEFLGDENVSYIHGGVIASLIDVAGDFALITLLGRGLPTVDMRVDYLRAAKPEDLLATATAVKKGRSLGVSDVVVESQSGRKVAVGRALYSTAPTK